MATTIGELQVRLRADFSALGKDLTKAGGEFTKFNKQVGRFGKATQSLGRSFLATVGLPLIAAAAAATKFSISFEDAMLKSITLAGRTADELDAMKKGVEGIAKATGRGPVELAEAFFFINSSGIEASKALALLEVSAKGATIGMGDAATVAQVLTSALNAYRKSGLTAAQAGDILTAAVAEGKAEAEDFGGSLGRLLPIASEMGIAFDEVAASVAALTLVGAKTDEAVTQIRSILNTILEGAPQATDALARLGISFGDLQTMLREEGLLATLQFLNEVFEAQPDIMTKVFENIRSMNGQLGLLGQNADKVAEVFLKVKGAAGDLDDSFSFLQDTTGQELREAFVALKVAAREIGDAFGTDLAGSLKSVAEQAQNLAKWYTNLSEFDQQLLRNTLKLTAAFGFLLQGVGILIRLFAPLISGLRFLVPAMVTFAAGITAVGFAVAFSASVFAFMAAGLALFIAEQAKFDLKKWASDLLFGRDALEEMAEALGTTTVQAELLTRSLEDLSVSGMRGLQSEVQDAINELLYFQLIGETLTENQEGALLQLNNLWRTLGERIKETTKVAVEAPTPEEAVARGSRPVAPPQDLTKKIIELQQAKRLQAELFNSGAIAAERLQRQFDLIEESFSKRGFSQKQREDFVEYGLQIFDVTQVTEDLVEVNEKLFSSERAAVEGVQKLRLEYLALQNPIVLLSRGTVAVTDGLASMFDQIISGAGSAKSAFKDFAKSMISQLISMFARALALKLILSALGFVGGAGLGGLSSLATSLTGSLVTPQLPGSGDITGATPRARGGPVSPGRSFVVGEMGPELFSPSSSGSILSNGSFGGGGVTIINQGPPLEVVQRRADGPSVEVIVRQMVNKGLNDGAFDMSMRRNFGNVRNGQ